MILRILLLSLQISAAVQRQVIQPILHPGIPALGVQQPAQRIQGLPYAHPLQQTTLTVGTTTSNIVTQQQTPAATQQSQLPQATVPIQGFPEPFKLRETYLKIFNTNPARLATLFPDSIQRILNYYGLDGHALFSKGTTLKDVLYNNLLQYYCLITESALFNESQIPEEKDYLANNADWKAYFFEVERSLGFFIPLFGDFTTNSRSTYTQALEKLSDFDLSKIGNDVMVKSGLIPSTLVHPEKNIGQVARASALYTQLNNSGDTTTYPRPRLSPIIAPVYPVAQVSGATGTTAAQTPVVPPFDPSGANQALSLAINNSVFAQALSKLTKEEFNSIPQDKLQYFKELLKLSYGFLDTTGEYSKPFEQNDWSFEVDKAFSKPESKIETIFYKLREIGSLSSKEVLDKINHTNTLAAHGINITPATADTPKTPTDDKKDEDKTDDKKTEVKTADATQEDESWSTTTWALIGVGALVLVSLAGLAIWYFVFKKQ
ncbi:hypothetical protein M153_5780002796 [Pseudoloma neurophilia]|uniref:Uncharacterized protein n=1 Tax=Pseudoloma neurophilia TaxID=146866 RepID=A0A0R0M2E0_9MICR|nr:hypothetical protein M153_5780002796 [Pseudoloma neurophilia]